MHEAEHFFDTEIKKAEDCIANDWAECFNGVKVGNKLAKNLNREHIVFCKNAKKSLANYENSRESKIADMQAHIDCLKAELAEVQRSKREAEKTLIKLDALEMPIRKACILICDTQDKHQEAYGMSDGFNMAISDLKQIAEHLLVYCNHTEVE